MSEAKIPARWQELHRRSSNQNAYIVDGPIRSCIRLIELIEELGAAEHERDALRAEVDRLKGDYNVLLDDCIDMRFKLAQARRDALDNWNNTIRERNALRAEVERLKDEHANQLMAIAQNETVRIAQYRRDALREAAYEAEGAHPNDESSDIANWLRGLADKD